MPDTPTPTEITNTVSHNVGRCPACREYLWSTVTIRTTVRPATIAPDGDCTASSISRPIAMQLEHSCSTSEETR